MTTEFNISVKRYDNALSYMALVIDEYGDEFWPIFQVLEDEYNLMLERQKKIRSRVKLIPPKQTAKHRKPNLVVFESV